MAVKHKFIISCAIIVCLLNIYYYRQYLIEAWMRFTLSTQPIVVTFTTTPHRIADLQPTLQTILDQNINVPIYLSIPYHFKRDNIAYNIPSWLQNEPRITIIRTQDYGPATKLLGLLEQVQLDPETIIITLDDDVYYPPNTVLQLAYKIAHTNNAAIGLVGANLDYDATHNIAADSELGLSLVDVNNAKVDVLKGYGSVAYKRKFFNEEIFKFVATQNPCMQADDIIFSYTLAKAKIDKIVLKTPALHQWRIRWQSEIGVDDHALHRLHPTPVEKHRSCLAYLHDLTPEVAF